MRRHEQQLISALAEGILDDESEARALIESSPTLMAEYKAQKAAIDAMRYLPAAQMTDAERSALRRDVWTELRTETPEPARGMAWFLRRPAMVTALVLIVGTFAVVGQLNSPQVSGTFSDIASGLQSSGGEISRSSADSPSDDDMQAEAQMAPEQDSLLAIDESVYEDIADSARSGVEKSTYLTTRETDGATSTFDECIADAGLEGYEFLGEARPSGNPVLVVSAVATPGSTTPIHFIDPVTCTVVYTAE